MTTLTMPTIKVEVAFQKYPKDTVASGDWTDITKYCLGLSTTLGRQHELNQVGPSTATMTLTNQDGRFSSWNTGSPYYYAGAGLTPGHPVRVTATWASVSYPIYSGFVKSYIPAYGATRATMTLACYDWLALLNFNSLDNTAYSILPLASATNYWPLDDPIGSASLSDDKGSAPFTAFYGTLGVAGPFPTSSATAVLFPSVWAQANTAASVPTSAAMSVDLWVNTTDAGLDLFTLPSLVTTGGDFSLWLVGGHVTAAVKGTTISTTRPNVADGQWHYVAMTYSGSVVLIYVDGALVGSGSATGTVTSAQVLIGFTSSSATMAQVALYPAVLTPAQITSQFALGSAGFVTQDTGSRAAVTLQVGGVPAAAIQSTMAGSGNVTVQGSTSSLATTTVMGYLNTVMSSERGLIYQTPAGVVTFRSRHYPYETSTSTTSRYTFGYTTGQLHYYSANIVPGMDDIDIWNNVLVGRNGGVVQQSQDTTSQTHYGRRTMNQSGLLFINDLDSQDLAQGLLSQYKDAKPRVRSLVVDNTIGAGAALPAMLGLDLLDRITVNWRPIDGSTIDFTQPSLVEQITHVVTPSTWTTTLAVTPVGTESFWILGTTALNNTTPVGLGF